MSGCVSISQHLTLFSDLQISDISRTRVTCTRRDTELPPHITQGDGEVYIITVFILYSTVLVLPIHLVDLLLSSIPEQCWIRNHDTLSEVWPLLCDSMMNFWHCLYLNMYNMRAWQKWSRGHRSVYTLPPIYLLASTWSLNRSCRKKYKGCIRCKMVMVVFILCHD